MSQEIYYLKYFEGNKEGDILSEKKYDSAHARGRKCLLPPKFSEIAQKIQEAQVREDDVWLVSFPRTGSTWCQEMIWLIQNNLDFKKAQSTMQQIRAPLIESPIVLFEYVDHVIDNGKPIPRYTKLNLPLELLPDSMEEEKLKLINLFTNSVDFVGNLVSPRCIKSHLAIDLLPEKIKTVKPKIIYTMRNPKDLCVSYYFHSQMVHKMNVEFETFCEMFLNDALPIGSVFDHYFGFWNKKHQKNILILTYEEMKKDTHETVKKIAKILDKSLTDEDVDAVCEFLSFQNMRENKGCNLQHLVDNKKGEDFYEKSGSHFIRKGIVGDHKNYMSPEMINRFDKWIEENTKGTDLKFD